jgi:hypothetical protein
MSARCVQAPAWLLRKVRQIGPQADCWAQAMLQRPRLVGQLDVGIAAERQRGRGVAGEFLGNPGAPPPALSI